MVKSLNLLLDVEITTKAQDILEYACLDLQTFFTMCMKKLIKEQGISFLSNSTFNESREQAAEFKASETKPELFKRPFMNEKNKITPVMRDCVWDIFKEQFDVNKKINYPYSEQVANLKSGINQGSAHIYFLFLNNLIAGVHNTRIIKFDDLICYLNYIKTQLPEYCFRNAIISLTKSIPYWKQHTTLYSFAEKVEMLISSKNI